MFTSFLVFVMIFAAQLGATQSELLCVFVLIETSSGIPHSSEDATK